MKNVIKTLGKSLLIPLGLRATALTADAGIHIKNLGSGTIILIISNKKNVTYKKDSGLLIKCTGANN